MTTQIGACVFVDPSEIRHDVINGNPTLTFGEYPTVRRLDLHLGDRATIHAVIAHLVALEQEMDPPVIPPAERDCPEVRDGWHCHRSGDHGVHEDDNGDQWRTACGARPYPAGSEGDDGTECLLPLGHDGEHDDTDGGVLFPAGCDPDVAADRTPLCDSELPLKHGGSLACVKDAGHYGMHSAVGGSYRWLGHGADARDEQGDKIAPVSVAS